MTADEPRPRPSLPPRGCRRVRLEDSPRHADTFSGAFLVPMERPFSDPADMTVRPDGDELLEAPVAALAATPPRKL